MFEKVLIANRGEIAARIARTCKRMGVETVAVYSEADADGAHCQACDESVPIGPSPVRESYLNIEAIIAAAKQTGAQAIHPGYGLLSENPALARACQEAELVFIGPSPEVLETLGDKCKARQVAISAGVRTLHAVDEPVTSVEAARTAAQELDFPLMVKAVAGGGGIGISRVADEEELAAAVQKASERAEQSFGDGRVYLEMALNQPRHIEVQIVADSQGQVVAVGDRECSVQRRHQKLIEEGPSPSLNGSKEGERIREAMWDAAIRIAREAGYVNAGTVEFLVDSENRSYFLEMNPRLQVEHGITEMCTGVDIVEMQLRIASGESMPPEAERANTSGHAMEARVCAENVPKGFLPAPGKVETLRWPNASPGKVRIETELLPGHEVTPHYDPMVAKIICYAPTRHRAMLLLDRMLAESIVEPLTTNIPFLRRVIAHESFRAGCYDTALVGQIPLQDPEPEPPPAPQNRQSKRPGGRGGRSRRKGGQKPQS